jgi:hypothetical protein
MFTALRGRLTTSRHLRLHSQEDVRLNSLAPPYRNSPAAESHESVDWASTGESDSQVYEAQRVPLGDEDDWLPSTRTSITSLSDNNPTHASQPLKANGIQQYWILARNVCVCLIALGLYIYLYFSDMSFANDSTFAYISTEIDPKPHDKSSATWKTPMIIFGLVTGFVVIIFFIYSPVAKPFRPKYPTSEAIHRSNKQLLWTSLALLPFIILLPINLAITPNIIASAIAEKRFNTACDGWVTSFTLNSISSSNGMLAAGSFFSSGLYIGLVTLDGGEAGWRVSYTRDANAPADFNDYNLSQVAFNSDSLGQSFTTLCNAVAPNVSNTIDCTSGSALSFVQHNPSSDVSVFTDEEIPVVSLLFGPPATMFTANYSNWENYPPLGILYDQNMNEEVKVVRKGNQNACYEPMKVCGTGFFQTFVSMAYVWGVWQQWGIGEGNCGI